MTLDTLPYLIPYLISFSISIGIGVYAWDQKHVAGRRYFAVINFLQAAWIFGYVIELLSTSLEVKSIWDDIQLAPSVLIAPFMLLFVIHHIQHPYHSTKWLSKTLLVVPVILIILLFTNQFHHLMRSDVRLLVSKPFNTVDYDFAIGYWIFALFSYLMITGGMWLLFRSFNSSKSLYRSQMIWLVVGFFVPIIGSWIPLFTNFSIAGQRDVSPFMFGISNIIIAWAIFRYKLLDLVPIARELVIENMQDIVLVVDAQQRLVDFNHAAETNIQQLTPTLIGRPIKTALSEWVELIERFQDDDEIYTQFAVPVQNENKYFDLRISPLRDSQAQLIGKLIIMHDITQSKQTELKIRERTQQLEIANKQLKQLSQVKDEFVSNVSHELKTPITNLKLNQDLIRRNPAKSDTYLGRLERETDRLNLIIEDLLRLSRFDQERSNFQMSMVDLHQLCSEYVDDRTPLAEAKQITLTYIKGDNLQPVRADYGFMGQVLSILLTNAINYTSEGGAIKISTQAKKRDGLDYVGFSASDTGSGILPEEQTQIFQRFYRGASAGKSRVPGTGLGLAIAQEIVKYHGGSIEIDSQGIAGEGTRFYVWLPAQQVKSLS